MHFEIRLRTVELWPNERTQAPQRGRGDEMRREVSYRLSERRTMLSPEIRSQSRSSSSGTRPEGWAGATPRDLPCRHRWKPPTQERAQPASKFFGIQGKNHGRISWSCLPVPARCEVSSSRCSHRLTGTTTPLRTRALPGSPQSASSFEPPPLTAGCRWYFRGTCQRDTSPSVEAVARSCRSSVQ